MECVMHDVWCVICDVWSLIFFVRSWIYESRGDQKHPIWVVSRFCSGRPKWTTGGNHLYTISCKTSYGNFRSFLCTQIEIWDHFVPLLFPKNSESLKILDIQLQEVGAKRRLNGTSKVNRRTVSQSTSSLFLSAAASSYSSSTILASLSFSVRSLE